MLSPSSPSPLTTSPPAFIRAADARHRQTPAAAPSRQASEAAQPTAHSSAASSTPPSAHLAGPPDSRGARGVNHDLKMHPRASTTPAAAPGAASAAGAGAGAADTAAPTAVPSSSATTSDAASVIVIPNAGAAESSAAPGSQHSPTAPTGNSFLSASPTAAPAPAASHASFLGKGALKLSRKDTTSARDVKESKPAPKTTSPLTTTPSVPTSDPLSQHIIARTATDRSLTSRILNPTGKPEPPTVNVNEGHPRQSSDLSTAFQNAQAETVKDKKKGGLLSRLSMIGGGKRKDHDIRDDASDMSSELRAEGTNATAFSSHVGARGFIPHHKEPPRFVKFRSHSKKVKEFNRVFLAQELVGTQPHTKDGEATVLDGEFPLHGRGKRLLHSGGPIWAVQFSHDGKYMATGGRDKVVRIWAVLATPEDRKAYEKSDESPDEDESPDGEQQCLSAPVFFTKPVQEFTGHTGDILDLTWSKNNFLLSSAMDKTVRLWHMSRQESICTFKHQDYVTSIAFHPLDDRFFLAGSLDATLRLWSIPDKAVAYSSQLSDVVTAVGFSPDGKTSIAGCLNGLCNFYETVGLKYQTQIHVRSSRGKNAKGSKITGIRTIGYPPESPDDEVKVLITSNDSRIRIYDLEDKSLEGKIKGLENVTNQIKASFNDDGKYIICGSEDGKAFIWTTELPHSEKEEKRPHEYLEAHSEVVTNAVFAPTETRRLLQASKDPVYTLCNPPPVTLLSKEESEAATDTESEKHINVTKPDESPAFLKRASHMDGNIIVTTDQTGLIKVFRQDCAFAKRRQAQENWETGSTFSKKMARDSLIGRNSNRNSLATSIHSRDPHSRQASVSRNNLHHQLSNDRIDTWRQGVEGNPRVGRPTSLARSTPTPSERSMSPQKAPARAPLVTNSAANARRQPYTNPNSTSYPISPTSSIRSGQTASDRPGNINNNSGSNNNNNSAKESPSMPPTPSFSLRSAEEEERDGGLNLDPAGASYSFWNLNRWRHMGLNRSSLSGSSSPTNNKRRSRLSHDSSSAAAAPMNADRRASADVRQSIEEEDEDEEDEPTPTANNNKQLRSPTARKGAPEGGSGNESPGGDSELRIRPGRLEPPSQLLRAGSGSSCLSSEVMGASADEELTSGLEEEGGTEQAGASSEEDMQCTRCGGSEFRAKKVAGRQWLVCSRCGRAAVDS